MFNDAVRPECLRSVSGIQFDRLVDSRQKRAGMTSFADSRNRRVAESLNR
jgi:hypothetical protein